MIAPRVAINNTNTTTKIKNIVLIRAVAQRFREPLYFQFVNAPILYAENVLDHNHDRLLSVYEAKSNCF
jgi:uncharacterized protein